MKKFDISLLSASILVLALVVLGVYQSAVEEKKDPVLAKAGDTTITQQQLYREMKDLYGKQVASELVAEALILQEAKQQNIAVPSEEIAAEVNRMKDQLGSDQAFHDYLATIGMDEQELSDRLKTLMTRDKLLDKIYPVTEEQIQVYYDQNKDMMGSPAPELAQVREQIIMILTDTNRQANAEQLWTDLKEKHRVEWFDPSLADEQVETAAQH